MAEIFSTPEEVKVPQIDFANYNWKEEEKREDKFIKNLKQFLIDCGFKGKNVGEEIRFPVGDGYARYMVMSMSPVKLVHLPLGDAWEFQYVHLMTAKEVQENIDRQKAMAKLFSK